MIFPGFERPVLEAAQSSGQAPFWLVIARENLQRMWWLLITSTFLSVLLAIYNVYIAGVRTLYSWSAFDIGGSFLFLFVFWLAKRGRVRDHLLWWLGPAYFAFWLMIMLGYYSTGLYAYGETSAFLIGAITPSAIILLPMRVVSILLLGYYTAFCMVLFGPWFAWRETNAIAASFLNGSLGVIVAFLAAWFLYRFRYKNLESEALIREQAEKARLDERTVRAILENMPFRAWLKNVDGRFLAVNRSYAVSLGKSPEEVISKTVEDFLDPEAAALIREQDRFVIEKRDRLHVERVETVKGEPRWLEVFKCPVFAEDGSVAAIAGLTVDITEKKKLAESLIATDRAKSQFLAMMSHEIRTPMNSILGYSELLCGEIKEPEAVEQLRIIRDNGRLLLAIIDDILDLSKIEAGQLDLHPAPFETAELVERIRRRFASIAEQKNITLSTENTAIPFAVADSRRLEQVLGNLVSNAVKFTSRGTVSLCVSTEPTSDDSYILKCVVRDSGIGISKTDLGRLFQPFTQVDSSIGRKYGGSGLGLVIARTLCIQMGGNLVVESAEGEGSTFTATVRVTRPNDIPLDHDEAASDSSGLAGLRVLVIEDNSSNRRLLAVILGKWGVEATLAETGEEALEKIKAAEYDVMLMDVQMPGMDGFETTRLIRQFESEHPERKRCRIIAVTALAMVGDEQKCFDAGMDSYIGKPLNIPKLMKALR